MDKIAQAYKIGSRLALSKYLPNLSRNQLLALGGAGSGLGALALGLSAAESKALAKGLVGDLASAAPKAGLVGDLASAATKPGVVDEVVRAATKPGVVGDLASAATKPGVVDEVVRSATKPGVVDDVARATSKWDSIIKSPDYGRALEAANSRIQYYNDLYKGTSTINYGDILDELVKSIKASPGQVKIPGQNTWDAMTSSEILKKISPGDYDRLDKEFLVKAKRMIDESATRYALKDLYDVRGRLWYPYTSKVEELSDLVKTPPRPVFELHREASRRANREAVEYLRSFLFRQ